LPGLQRVACIAIALRATVHTFVQMSDKHAAPGSPSRLVVFDLDGTLTYHDTFLPFVLGYCRRKPWLLLRFIAVLPLLAAFLLRMASHGRVKEAVIRRVLGGQRRAELRAWATEFVMRLHEHGFRPEALAVLAQHQENGDRLVLLSASPDLYVPVIGARLGFQETLCTSVRWAGDRLEGSLTTPNRRGEEKARCIQALRQGHPGLRLVAYANGPSDIEHLQLADEKLLVNAPPGLSLKAKELGIPSAHWR
jgi:phosphatidylglycerophosphatase C